MSLILSEDLLKGILETSTNAFMALFAQKAIDGDYEAVKNFLRLAPDEVFQGYTVTLEARVGSTKVWMPDSTPMDILMRSVNDGSAVGNEAFTEVFALMTDRLQACKADKTINRLYSLAAKTPLDPGALASLPRTKRCGINTDIADGTDSLVVHAASACNFDFVRELISRASHDDLMKFTGYDGIGLGIRLEKLVFGAKSNRRDNRAGVATCVESILDRLVDEYPKDHAAPFESRLVRDIRFDLACLLLNNNESSSPIFDVVIGKKYMEDAEAMARHGDIRTRFDNLTQVLIDDMSGTKPRDFEFLCYRSKQGVTDVMESASAFLMGCLANGRVDLLEHNREFFELLAMSDHFKSDHRTSSERALSRVIQRAKSPEALDAALKWIGEARQKAINGQMPAFELIQNSSVERMQFIAKMKFDLNFHGEPALVIAAQRFGDDVIDCMGVLLKHGADPEAKDNRGWKAMSHLDASLKGEWKSLLQSLAARNRVSQLLAAKKEGIAP